MSSDDIQADRGGPSPSTTAASLSFVNDFDLAPVAPLLRRREPRARLRPRLARPHETSGSSSPSSRALLSSAASRWTTGQSLARPSGLPLRALGAQAQRRSRSPGGYANGFMTLTEGAAVMFFSVVDARRVARRRRPVPGSLLGSVARRGAVSCRSSASSSRRRTMPRSSSSASPRSTRCCFRRPITVEVLLVDDASTDGTVAGRRPTSAGAFPSSICECSSGPRRTQVSARSSATASRTRPAGTARSSRRTAPIPWS